MLSFSHSNSQHIYTTHLLCIRHCAIAEDAEVNHVEPLPLDDSRSNREGGPENTFSKRHCMLDSLAAVCEKDVCNIEDMSTNNIIGKVVQ